MLESHEDDEIKLRQLHVHPEQLLVTGYGGGCKCLLHCHVPVIDFCRRFNEDIGSSMQQLLSIS